jgi:hypothetical protein
MAAPVLARHDAVKRMPAGATRGRRNPRKHAGARLAERIELRPFQQASAVHAAGAEGDIRKGPQARDESHPGL